jgi:hypothetical protein
MRIGTFFNQNSSLDNIAVWNNNETYKAAYKTNFVYGRVKMGIFSFPFSNIKIGMETAVS